MNGVRRNVTPLTREVKVSSAKVWREMMKCTVKGPTCTAAEMLQVE